MAAEPAGPSAGYYCGAVGTSGYKSANCAGSTCTRPSTTPNYYPSSYDKSYFGAAVLPSIGHQDAKVAHGGSGHAQPYDNGPQRCGMIATGVTNWIDSGWLRNYSVRLRVHPLIFRRHHLLPGAIMAIAGKRGVGLVDLEAGRKYRRPG